MEKSEWKELRNNFYQKHGYKFRYDIDPWGDQIPDSPRVAQIAPSGIIHNPHMHTAWDGPVDEETLEILLETGQGRLCKICFNIDGAADRFHCPKCNRFVSGQWDFCRCCGKSLRLLKEENL